MVLYIVLNNNINFIFVLELILDDSIFMCKHCINVLKAIGIYID